jgi:TolB-like protein/tetratricopeptide (TPR) repeat protein
MSDPGKAVFLSYASQDAEAARRICEALRSGGVEVWFDADGGLEHGDEWDQKIRRQIKECVLFIPVISANTQARHEGYFRIEWELAAQRAMGIASGVAFILPVVIDATREADALVPDRFRMVQWTKLPGGVVTPEVKARYLKLWSHRIGAAKGAGVGTPGELPPEERFPSAPRGAHTTRFRQRRWLAPAIAASVVIVATAVWIFGGRSPPSGSPSRPQPQDSTTAAKAAPVSESRKLVLQARALIDDDWLAVRENFRMADELCERATRLDPTDGEAWATWGRVSAEIIRRNYDTSTPRMEMARSRVERGLQLAPDSIEAGLAMALVLARNQSRPEAVRRLRDLLTRAPLDARVARCLAAELAPPGGRANAEATEIRLHHPSFGGRDPRPLVDEARSMCDSERFAECEELLARADTLGPCLERYSMGLAYLTVAIGDLEAAKELAAKIPPRLLSEDVFGGLVSGLWLRLRDGDKALSALRWVPRDFLEDMWYAFPKGLLTGQAHWIAGRRVAAEAEWKEAIVVLDKRLTTQPNDGFLLRTKALLLARLGQKEESERIWRLSHELKQWNSGLIGYWRTSIHLANGENEAAIRLLESTLVPVKPGEPLFTVNKVRYEFQFDPIRNDPRVQKILAEGEALVRTMRHRNSAAGSRQVARETASAPAKSVAVLAFRQLSADPENEYLCEAISDELCNVLGRVPGLRVAASASAFSFKGKRVRPSEMAAQLGVAYLVDGTVQKIGNRVRVRATLIKAADETPVWNSENLDHDVKDMFAVQDEVVGAIAKNLQVQLGATARATTINPEAFRLYYEGRRAWSMRGTAEFVVKSEEFFRQAIAVDAKLGRAYSGLADVLRNAWAAEPNGLTYADRNSDRLRELQSLVETALRWEPESAEAYTARGGISWQTWRFLEAERDLRTAIRLNPNYADAHLVLGRLLSADGRIEEALAELKVASELDPLSSRIFDNYGGALREAGRYTEALVQAERAVALQPDSPQALRTKMNALSNLGRHDEAIAIARSLAFRDAEFRSVVVFARAGQKEEAARRYAMARPSLRSTTAPLVALGRYEEALNSLRPDEAAVTSITGLFYYDTIDPIRNDPRFVNYLTDLGVKAAHDRAQAWRKAHPPEKPQARK